MTIILFVVLIALIAISAFFSGSETSMMALNRYRLRHAARHNKAAKRCQTLLERPDKLLGLILIGNTFANILASALATMIAVEWFGNIGVAISTIVLTAAILIFAEVMPKTVGAYHPQGFAFRASGFLSFLLKIFRPVVWLLSKTAHLLLRPFGMQAPTNPTEDLTQEELQSVVRDSTSSLPAKHQHMLISVLEQEKITMADCMIPRQNVVGIDLEQSWDSIFAQIKNCPYSKLPIYRGELNNVIGILKLRDIIALFDLPQANKEELEKLLTAPYFIPESTTLHQQLINFQQNSEDMGMVVDEYGDVQGVVTVEDIVEEIVGEFTNAEQPTANDFTHCQPDGSFIVEGAMTVRDVNRDLNIALPTDGPKTLSGLITEYLESIPVTDTCVKIADYPIEILSIRGRAVKRARIGPKIKTAKTSS